MEEAQYKTILTQAKKDFFEIYDAPTAVNKSRSDSQFTDFDIQVALGEGAFGQVVLVQHKKTNELFAMKILGKRQIVKTKQVDHAKNEKNVLLATRFPNLINMTYFFIDNTNLYFIMTFINGGDLFGVLQHKRTFSDELAKFYAVQVILGLEYLHYMDIVYRDLKPENILMGHNGYIKITDFGFCKKIRGRTYTLCGTPEYLAPEMILNKGYGKCADWWSFGVLIFEFCCGWSPFTGGHNMNDQGDHVKLYENIVRCKYKIPGHYSKELKDLIVNLLQVDASRRFGNLKNGIRDIKTHGWFKDISFLLIYQQEVRPPWKPALKGLADLSAVESQKKFNLKVGETMEFEDEFADF